VDHITLFCFFASYSVALALDLLHQSRPRPVTRMLSLGFGAAGLLAQTLYLAVQRPPLAWQFGWLLVISWVFAIFYLYGALHHNKVAWGVFVLPLVLGLVALAAVFGRPDSTAEMLPPEFLSPRDERFWGLLHALLLLCATVGLCVGFLASLMFLFQANRLRVKRPPGQGLRLLSLERLEAMNRRAVAIAFPLLTVGMLIGAVLMSQVVDQLAGWTDPRVLATGVLWLAFAVLLRLRYGYHLRGRPAALLTIVGFGLLLLCLALSHPVGQAGSQGTVQAGGRR
jgi:ABC-type transport system involved in cytochrome c biogenesis permease subunit